MMAFPETRLLMELLALGVLGLLGSRKGLSGGQEVMEGSPCLGTVGDWALLAHGCRGRLAHPSKVERSEIEASQSR